MRLAMGRRLPGWRGSEGSGVEDVADAADGADVLAAVVVGSEFPAEPEDVHGNGLTGRVVAGPPDLGDQRVSSAEPAGVEHETVQQLELLQRQRRQRPAVNGDPHGPWVEFDTADGERFGQPRIVVDGAEVLWVRDSAVRARRGCRVPWSCSGRSVETAGRRAGGVPVGGLPCRGAHEDFRVIGLRRATSRAITVKMRTSATSVSAPAQARLMAALNPVMALPKIWSERVLMRCEGLVSMNRSLPSAVSTIDQMVRAWVTPSARLASFSSCGTSRSISAVARITSGSMIRPSAMPPA